MSHIALYRKYRPKTFGEVVGQGAIVTSLKNQVSSGKIGHAFLFTGTRGTGKTSCAKIFAKAINCINSHAGEPCLKCDVCIGIENESIYDVTEIDAASNNSVENIRDILGEVIYLPVMAKYKVYIIDEVHMLSTAAFNALLKTLEEPPPHVIFILATTELHKIPATILSRCQRYDFTKLSIEEIGEAILDIAQCEGISISISAARTIAGLADGAMRDAASILDTCRSHSDTIDDDIVCATVGISNKEDMFTISQAILNKDLPKALQTILGLEQKSVDFKRLCEELIVHFRNLLLANLNGTTYQLLNISQESFERLKAQAKDAEYDDISNTLTAFTIALESISKGLNSKVSLDIALFTVCNNVKPNIIQSRVVNKSDVVSIKEPPKQAQPIKQVQEITEFTPWNAVMDKINETDKPLYSFMEGSEAYLYDNIVYIDGNEAFNGYIRINKEAAAIVKKAILEVCNRPYHIGGYKNIAHLLEDKKTDEISNILALRDKGVEVNIE